MAKAKYCKSEKILEILQNEDMSDEAKTKAIKEECKIKRKGGGGNIEALRKYHKVLCEVYYPKACEGKENCKPVWINNKCQNTACETCGFEKGIFKKAQQLYKADKSAGLIK